MAEYGNTIEPGIVTNVESALVIATSGGAPADVGLVGQADFANGTADPEAVYQVTSATDARDFFGDSSPLTKNIIDALDEGAYPVYAAAPAETSVTGEDLSGLTSHSGTLADGPVSENAGDTTFTINGTAMTTVITLDDPSNAAPGAGEVALNPATKEFQIDSGATVGSTGDSVDYIAYDYTLVNDALAEDAGGAIDFYGSLVETQSVTDDVQTTVGGMADEYNFALAAFGAGPYITDTTAYTNSYDDSRIQLVYPSRDADGNSTIGSFLGKRATLGISATPINKRLETKKKLSEKLSLAERGNLIDERVVPLAQEAAGARIADDVNSVSDTNTSESAIRYGFTRLVIDYVLSTVRVNEQPFIGRLNEYAVRKALEGLLNNQLRTMTRSNAVIDYTVRVKKVDATTAKVKLGVETAKPLRFIENTVTVGSTS